MTDDTTPLERDASATIHGFLAERREWELRTMERVMGWRRGDAIDPSMHFEADTDELDRCWAELADIRAFWCTTDAVARANPNASYSNASEFDPDQMSIVELSRVSDESVIVRTREVPSELQPTAYEYRLRLVGPRWRIDQRAMVEPGWDRIDDLL